MKLGKWIMGNVIEEKDTEKMKLGKWLMGNVIEEKYTTQTFDSAFRGSIYFDDFEQTNRQTATIMFKWQQIFTKQLIFHRYTHIWSVTLVWHLKSAKK